MRKLIERIQSRRRTTPWLLAGPDDVVARCHEEMAVIADERLGR